MTRIQGYRLSQQQESWWRERRHLLAQCALILTGSFSEAEVQRALTGIVARHTILRTRYRMLPGRLLPLQVIDDQPAVRWRLGDLQACSQEQQASTLQELLREEGAAAFAYEQGPLVHALIARLTAERTFLCLTLPSLHADTRSLLLLLEELQAELTARTPAWLEEEPVQYVQFAEWQSEQNCETDGEPGRAFWQRQDGAEAALPALPLTMESEALAVVPASRSILLSRQEYSGLRTSAARLGVALEDLMFAGWHLFLQRLCGQSQLAVSRVLDGRAYDELQRSIGLYELAPAMHFAYPEQTDLRAICAELADLGKSACDWLEYYRPQPVGRSLPCLFSYHRTHAWPGMELMHLQADIQPYSWYLRCLQHEDGLSLYLSSGRPGESAELLASSAQCYHHLLRQLAENHAILLKEITLLDGQAEAQLRTVLSGPPLEVSELFPDLFSRQAARTPELPALVCDGLSLTYRQLDQRSNQLAHFLLRLGVGPNVRVALCLNRSLTAIVALLGIWKAGGAYVPIDPDDPKERRLAQLRDVEAALILTEGDLLADLARQPLPVLGLDEQQAEIEQEALTCPVQSIAPDQLAYIIYTSGSTGTPNGVCVEHRNLANYYAAIRSQVALGCGATYASVSTLSADLGNTLILLALASGGCLHLLTREALLDARTLGAYFEQQQIDCLKIVPSHFGALLQAGGAVPPIPRRLLIFGGERLPWDLVHTVHRRAPDCALLHHYGPTETTIGVLTYPIVPAADTGLSRSVPLGRPLGNTRLYVLDRYLHAVPPGGVGELLIGGANVTRGYWRRPRLSEARYLQYGLPGVPERVYRTGDLVRILPGGQLEFVGRADRQVKIHGQRVELGEIEALLERHPQVREAVVMLRPLAGEPQLVAYVVLQRPMAVQELSSYVQQHLPTAYVPAVITEIGRFPLTSNGKRDIHALPDPSSQRPVRICLGPSTQTERQVLECWQQVLGGEALSIDDRFFEAGGNSLKSIQLLALLQHHCATLRMTDLFEYNTIRLMSQYLDRLLDRAGRGEVIENIEL